MGHIGVSSQKIITGDYHKKRVIKSFLVFLYLFSLVYTYYLFDKTSGNNQNYIPIIEEENGKFFPSLGFHTFQNGEVTRTVIEDQGLKSINIVIDPKKTVEYNGFGFHIDMNVPFNSTLVFRLRNNSRGKQILLNITDNYQGGEQFFKAVSLKSDSVNEFRIPLKEFQRNEWQPPGASSDGHLNADGIAIVAVSVSPGNFLDVNLLSVGFEWGISPVYFYTYFALFLFCGLLLLHKKIPEDSLKTFINAHYIIYFIYFMCGAIGIYFISSPVFQTDQHCYIVLLSILAVTILDRLLFLKGWFDQIWLFRYIIAISPVYYLKSDYPVWAIPLFFLTIVCHIPFLVTRRFALMFLSVLGPLVLIFIKGIGDFHGVLHGVTALISGGVFSYLFIFFHHNRMGRIEAEHKDQLIRGILEKSSDGILLLDTSGNILSSNRGFQKMVMEREDNIAGLNILDFIPKETQNAFVLNNTEFDLLLKTKDDRILDVYVRIKNLYKSGKLSGYIATISDITEHKNAEKEKDRLITELQQALKEIKTLRGILPICSFCKKIRDDKGYWNQIESYIHKHSDADFSHSICPDCVKKYYPDIELEDDIQSIMDI